MIILLAFLNYYANSQSTSNYISKISNQQAIEIRLRYSQENNTYYYTRESITLTENMKTTAYNATSLSIDEEKNSIYIPDDGLYWFIPAIPSIEPFQLREKTNYCFMCSCSGTGNCYDTSNGSSIYCAENCSACCDLYILWCDDYWARINYGGGVLIKSDAVELDE